MDIRTFAENHAKCHICKKRIVDSGLPLFWTLSAQRHGIDGHILQQHMGLAQFFGGGGPGHQLAEVMGLGSSPEFTKPMTDELKVTLCEGCSEPLMMLLAKAGVIE